MNPKSQRRISVVFLIMVAIAIILTAGLIASVRPAKGYEPPSAYWIFPHTEVPDQFCMMPDAMAAAALTQTNIRAWNNENANYLDYDATRTEPSQSPDPNLGHGTAGLMVALLPNQTAYNGLTGQLWAYPDTFQSETFTIFCELTPPFLSEEPVRTDFCPDTLDKIVDWTGLPAKKWSVGQDEHVIYFDYAGNPYKPHPARIDFVPAGVLILRSDIDHKSKLDDITITPGYTEVEVDNIDQIAVFC